MRILVRATLGWGLSRRPSPQHTVIDVPTPDLTMGEGWIASHLEQEARAHLRYGFGWQVDIECLIPMPSAFLMLESCGYSISQMGPGAYRPMESE